MSKKDFSQVNVDRVMDAITTATAAQETKAPRKTYTEQEAREHQENMNTSGRKGAGLKRINVAFKPSNYEYVSTMSRSAGITMTRFLNLMIEDHHKRNKKLYDEALEFRRRLEK